MKSPTCVLDYESRDLEQIAVVRQAVSHFFSTRGQTESLARRFTGRASEVEPTHGRKAAKRRLEIRPFP
jgi:hypothetical protein